MTIIHVGSNIALLPSDEGKISDESGFLAEKMDGIQSEDDRQLARMEMIAKLDGSTFQWKKCSREIIALKNT